MGWYRLPDKMDEPIESIFNPQGVELRGRKREWNLGDGGLKFIIIVSDLAAMIWGRRSGAWRESVAFGKSLLRTPSLLLCRNRTSHAHCSLDLPQCLIANPTPLPPPTHPSTPQQRDKECLPLPEETQQEAAAREAFGRGGSAGASASAVQRQVPGGGIGGGIYLSRR